MANHISIRERTIVEKAADGLTDKEIAKQLNLASSTVRTYWDRMRTKTGAKNRAEAVARVLGDELRSALREAVEARHDRDLLLEAAEGYAVFSLSTDGAILDWNPGILRVLGYEREDFLGNDFSIIFTPDDVETGEPKRELQEARRRGRCLEKRYHMKRDGTQIWIDGTLVAVHDDLGKIRGFAKIMRDDSERKALEEEVQRLRARI